jgi:Flp pilus assembly secretin CpaC
MKVMFGIVRSTRMLCLMQSLAACLLAVLCLNGGPSRAEPAAIETIILTMDHAKLVKLPSGADTIVIGNPAIADVTVQKNGVLVLTGRAAGRTNFIALNASGSIISESVITVTLPTDGRVLVQRGLDRQSYDCAPSCLPSITLGDDEKHFNRAVDQSQRRDAMANQSATSGGAKK